MRSKMSSGCAIAARILFVGAIFLLGILLVITVRTVQLYYRDTGTGTHQPSVKYVEKFNSEETDQLVEKLRQSIRFRTISYGLDDARSKSMSNESSRQFRELTTFLEKTFPRAFGGHKFVIRHLGHEGDGDFFPSILLHVKGKNHSLPEYLLCAHLDVVPADSHWADGRDPFEPAEFSQKRDRFLYGRGAIDNKHNLLSILEAVDGLTQQPTRGFYVAFGHDEEISGLNGAYKMAKYIGRQLNGKKLAFAMDEGLYVLNGALPGVIDQPIASIGVAEKGYLTVSVSATSEAGHSAIPPPHDSAITKLAEALTRFTGDTHPAGLPQLQRDAFWALAPHAKFPYNVLMANLWIFEPLVLNLMNGFRHLAALIRTTTAVTVIVGGVKENVLPSEAHAIINHRILQDSSVHETMERDRKLIEGLPVKIELREGREPVPTNHLNGSSTNTPEVGMTALRQTMTAVFPSAIVTPWLCIAGTDSRHYVELTNFIYRFSPLIVHMNDAARVHGSDERIEGDQYRQMCNFYWHLIRTMNSISDDCLSESELQ